MLGGRWRKAARRSAEALFPRSCLSCKEEGELLCESCFALWMPEPKEDTDPNRFSFGRYANPALRKMIGAWKYAYDESAARFLERFMEKAADEIQAYAKAQRAEAVIPIRLFRARERERGFDQALELARMIGKMTALPVEDSLRRKRATGKQVERSDAWRLRAMKRNPFLWIGGDVPQSVLLVDDVFTTGATAAAACEVLILAGVKKIAIVTVADGGDR